MDLLYSRYASPFEFMERYIRQGRFGEFVSEIVYMAFQRKKEEAEKRNDDRMWSLYIHSMSNRTFEEWKKELETKQEPKNYSMTNEEIGKVKQQAKGILEKISPV